VDYDYVSLTLSTLIGGGVVILLGLIVIFWDGILDYIMKIHRGPDDETE